MELPYNTTISADMLKGTGQFQEHVAAWDTRRRWVDEAFDALERAGYTIGSAYTAVKDPSRTKFVYRDRAVAGRGSRGARRGVVRPHQRRAHAERRHVGDSTPSAIDRGELPLGRAYRPTADERLIRETILQLKRGAMRPAYFAAKFGVDIGERFAPVWQSIARDGFLAEPIGRSHRADARGAAARRYAAAPLLPARTPRNVRYT